MDTYRKHEQFIAALEDGSLPPSQFKHLGHVRAAWYYLSTTDTEQACERFAATIERYASMHGEARKYHATMTRALLTLIAHRLSQCDRARDWSGFASRNLDLLADARGLLECHYSREVLNSEAARKDFLAPDLLPLPLISPALSYHLAANE